MVDGPEDQTAMQKQIKDWDIA